jgi:formylglycine-generating enzyme required for sulfatase activity
MAHIRRRMVHSLSRHFFAVFCRCTVKNRRSPYKLMEACRTCKFMLHKGAKIPDKPAPLGVCKVEFCDKSQNYMKLPEPIERNRPRCYDITMRIVLIILSVFFASVTLYAQTDMVAIPGGAFNMGSGAAETGRRKDETEHPVSLNGFFIGRFEVTQKEYMEVMGVNPSFHKGDDLPVEYVSLLNAIEFCNKLSEKEGLTPVYTVGDKQVTWDREADGYRLPSEAEWEYACRRAADGADAAVTKTAYNTGNVITTDKANYYGRKTLPVGRFPPNGAGLFDMHGNVWEWCWDIYGKYKTDTGDDAAKPAIGWGSGMLCVVRGGSYRSTALYVRSASRGTSAAAYRSWDTGFRLARNVSREPLETTAQDSQYPQDESAGLLETP